MSGTELISPSASPNRSPNHPRPIHNSDEEEGLRPLINPIQNVHLQGGPTSTPISPSNTSTSIGDLSLIQLWQQHKYLILLVFGSVMIFFLFFASSSSRSSSSSSSGLDYHDYRAWKRAMAHTHSELHEAEEEEDDDEHHQHAKKKKYSSGDSDDHDSEQAALREFMNLPGNMPLDDVHYPDINSASFKRRFDQFLRTRSDQRASSDRSSKADRRKHKSRRHEQKHEDEIDSLHAATHQDLSHDLARLQRLIDENNQQQAEEERKISLLKAVSNAIPNESAHGAAGTIEIVFPEESSVVDGHIPDDHSSSEHDHDHHDHKKHDDHDNDDHVHHSKSHDGHDHSRLPSPSDMDDTSAEFIIHHPPNTLDSLATPSIEVAPAYSDEQLSAVLDAVHGGATFEDENNGEPLMNLANRHSPITHKTGEPTEPGLIQPKSPNHPTLTQHIDPEVTEALSMTATELKAISPPPPSLPVESTSAKLPPQRDARTNQLVRTIDELLAQRPVEPTGIEEVVSGFIPPRSDAPTTASDVAPAVTDLMTEPVIKEAISTVAPSAPTTSRDKVTPPRSSNPVTGVVEIKTTELEVTPPSKP